MKRQDRDRKEQRASAVPWRLRRAEWTRDKKFDAKKAKAAFAELGVDSEKADPARA